MSCTPYEYPKHDFRSTPRHCHWTSRLVCRVRDPYGQVIDSTIEMLSVVMVSTAVKEAGDGTNTSPHICLVIQAGKLSLRKPECYYARGFMYYFLRCRMTFAGGFTPKAR